MFIQKRGVMKRNAIIGHRKLGTISKSGETIIREMIYWNAINACDPEHCGCSSICDYFLSGEKPEKCEVIFAYMSSVLDMIIRNYPSPMTEDIAYRIGMHLIPLYKILCRLKMAEFSTIDVVGVSVTGTAKVTPLFKEIRNTIQLIEKTWHTIGFDVSIPNAKRRPLEQVGFFNGKSYYEVIEGGTNVQNLEAQN